VGAVVLAQWGLLYWPSGGCCTVVKTNVYSYKTSALSLYLVANLAHIKPETFIHSYFVIRINSKDHAYSE
jgi:hypothetical protein